MANQEIKKSGSSSSNPGEEYSYPYPYPYPYPLGVCVTNFVSVKLSGRDMYDVWETQMSCLLESHDMLCFVNTNPPAEKVGEWRRSDALEKGWILGSLSDQTLNFIVKTIPKEDFTSKNVWHKLKTCYGPLPPPAAAEEHDYRLIVFKSNLRRPKRHQLLDLTTEHVVTKFSDLTASEFRERYLGLKSRLSFPPDTNKALIFPTDDNPEEFD